MIVLKTYSDLKTRLQVSKVRLASGQKLTFFGNPLGPDEQAMHQLAEYGVHLIRDRASRGIGSDDAPMKPLSERRGRRWSKSQQRWVEYGIKNTGYKSRKVAMGGKPIRDLTLTGEMLSNISVRSVSASQARIDITSPKQRMKARANEIRSPWWGWSPSDLTKLTLATRQMFGMQIANLGIGSGRGRTFGSSAIWMNPFRHNFPGSVDAGWAEGLRGRIKGGTVSSLPRAA